MQGLDAPSGEDAGRFCARRNFEASMPGGKVYAPQRTRLYLPSEADTLSESV
jgi:hypothetical protein